MSDLPVGKELDELIARVVMEWHKGKGGAIGGVRGYQSPWCWYDAQGGMHGYTTPDEFANQYPWSPSVDIAAAWLVVEKLKTQGYTTTMFIYGIGVTVRIETGGSIVCTIEAQTAPHAICLAALQAKGYKP